jgi:DtxR family Mn-dependent transcriptional regulator
MASESTENYLLTIYRLTCSSPDASTKDIASYLGVSAPSVSEKIIRLSEQGYIEHHWRRGVTLTEKGRKTALKVLRKHRLIELFLVNVFKYSLDEVNEEACRLEHAVSERLADAMEAMLGYPETDPHGHPIPSREGAVPRSDFLSLADAPPGKPVLVSQVSDHDSDKLHYLTGIGVVPGAKICVLEAAPFDGPLSLDVEGKTAVIAHALARNVGVTPEEQKNNERIDSNDAAVS